MNKNIAKKKAGRPVTTGKGTPVMVRLLPELLDAVDKHQVATGAPSRPEAIRQILTDYLKRRALL